MIFSRSCRHPSRLPVRVGALAASAVLLVAGLSACSSGASSAGGNPTEIVLGLPAPLTGLGASVGVPAVKVAQLTVDTINANGGIKELGGAKLKLLVQDTQSNPTNVGTILRQMAAKKVSAFIGPLLSFETVPNVPLIQSLKIPTYINTADPSLTKNNVGGYIFRIQASATQGAQRTVQFIDSLMTAGTIDKAIKVGVLTTNTAPGPAIGTEMDSQLDSLGLSVTNVTYDGTQTKDFGPLVAKLAAADVDLVVGYQTLAESPLLAQAVGRQSWRPSVGFIRNFTAESNATFRTQNMPTVQGWAALQYVAGLDSSAFPDQVRSLATAYQQKNGSSLVDSGAAQLASNVALVADAVAKAKSADPQAIADASRGLTLDNAKASEYPYYVTAGGVKFDQNQDNSAWQGPIIQINGTGGIDVVYPQDVADATYHAGS